MKIMDMYLNNKRCMVIYLCSCMTQN